ncbi:uncharacterized protein [Alexandromys fortis]|uniref:uncharacterized protein n=1 Tax=Alexandromys fortis TaxID=100897 RepID=UPI002152E0D2|nr:uncharacterized protein LOC126498790 [Microtus fortis]
MTYSTSSRPQQQRKQTLAHENQTRRSGAILWPFLRPRRDHLKTTFPSVSSATAQAQRPSSRFHGNFDPRKLGARLPVLQTITRTKWGNCLPGPALPSSPGCPGVRTLPGPQRLESSVSIWPARCRSVLSRSLNRVALSGEPGARRTQIILCVGRKSSSRWSQVSEHIVHPVSAPWSYPEKASHVPRNPQESCSQKPRTALCTGNLPIIVRAWRRCTGDKNPHLGEKAAAWRLSTSTGRLWVGNATNGTHKKNVSAKITWFFLASFGILSVLSTPQISPFLSYHLHIW